MTDEAVIAFAKFLVRLRVLDVSDCVRLTSTSLRALHHYRINTLTGLDVGATHVSRALAGRWIRERPRALFIHV